ncbi:MarR family transcriptional regulator [Rhodopirellula europaea SH398]|uniref:MarR family transcriptional regulator n=1 Tax=Rhodopirellula europaea SH398 TaxID=1263868 RepID=M5SLC2_9BACT|nr:MarR family transcriptional regulator [Rhodopirellula europaea SH398]
MRFDSKQRLPNVPPLLDGQRKIALKGISTKELDAAQNVLQHMQRNFKNHLSKD